MISYILIQNHFVSDYRWLKDAIFYNSCLKIRNCINDDLMNKIKYCKINSNFLTLTQRDGVEREEGGGFRMGNTCIPVADSF